MNTINVYKAAFVRIWDETGEAILGAGALATPEGLVLTCAHVVGERETVRLDFPFLAPRRFFTARVVRRDPEADLAALRLEGELPAEAHPMPFALTEDVWQHPFRACGFPRGHDEGVWAKGVLLAPTGDRGWVQMEAEKVIGFAVQRGFSGAPVWDDRLNAAVGLVAAAAGERETRAAFCIPVAQLVAFWPDLDKHARPPNPYRGLEPFREQDAANFFGREKLSEELAERVRRDSLTVVLGASGSGKSSLVQAGLIPRIRALPGWVIALARPTEDPFRELARVLVPLLEPDLTEVKRLAEINDLANNLATGRVTLDDVVRRILEKQAGEHFLLVVDQFEELFTLVTDRAVRRRYLDMLLDAGEKPRTPLHLVLVMRMDFRAESRRLDQSLREHHFLVTSMSDEELRRAIVEPARRAHVTFEPGLVERILEDVGDEPGNLPLLEFALTQLWERQEYRRLTHAAYEAIGGVKGALIRHAEEVFHSLTPEEQAEAHRLFVQLVQPGEGTEDTRRRAHREQLGEKRWALARRLADERLVVTGGGGPTEPDYVEVAHEALIRYWPRLREWMREDREFRRWQERTRAQAARWREQGEPPGLLLQGRWLDEALDWLEKRKAEIEDTLAEYIRASQEERARRQAEEERRRRRTLRIVTGAAVFFLLLALLAGWQWRLAVQRQKVALARQLVITARTLLQEDPYGNAPTAALLGIEAARLIPSSEAYALLNDALERLPRRVLGRYEHKGPVSAVAFSPNGQWVVSGSSDGTAVVWEAATGRQTARFGHKDAVWAVAFSPDGKWVVSGSVDGTAVVWEATTGREVARFEHKDWVNAVAFSPHGRWVVSGAGDGTAVVWEAATGREVARFEHEGPVLAVAFSPDGKWVVSGSGDNTAVVWEAATGREVAWFKHRHEVAAVAFSPDGKWVVSRSSDGAVVWEAATGREVARFEHKKWVTAVAFSPDGKWVVSGGCEERKEGWCTKGAAVVWEAATGREVARFVHGDDVNAVAFSPDGKWVVSEGCEEWNKDEGRCTKGTAVVWEAATGREVARFEHEGPVLAVDFSPDGKWVVSGLGDGTAVVWEAATGREVARFEHEGPVLAVAFSPDGQWVVSGSRDRTAVVWEATTGREVARFVHVDDVNAVAFSPDGKWVVSGSGDGTAVVWEAATGREVAWFRHEVAAVAFSPDGKWVVSRSSGGTAVVWEAATGRQTARFGHFGHKDAVWAVAFSPDGRWVVSGSDDGTVAVWWYGPGLEHEICHRVPANLTLAAWQRYVGDLPYHPTCPNRPIPEDAQQAIRTYRQRRAFWAAAAGVLVLGLALAGFGRQRASLFAGFMGVAVSAMAGIAIWQAVNAWMYSTSLVQDALLGIGMVASAGWLLWPWKIRLQRRLFWSWLLASWLLLFATVWWGWEWLRTTMVILKELPLSPRQWALLGLTWLGAGLLVALSALALDYALFALYRRVRPRLGA